MSYYENIFIARQDISAAQVDTLADSFAAIIAALGGTVTKKESWGLKNLSYRIRKNRKGHYMLFNIDAPPAAVAEMERNMRLNEDVLRYLTVRAETLEEGPSAMLQSRQREGGREGGRDGGRERFRDRYDRPRRDRAPEPGAGAAEAEGGR